MNYLAIIKVVLSLFPLIIQGINTLEEAFPEPGQGPKKLEILKTTVQSAFNVANDAVASFEPVWNVIQSVVGSIVKLKNGIGK